jgi:GTP-binding protein EngB required for normal cell division
MVHVNGILDRVAELASQYHLVNLRPQIAACQQQLGAPERIDVAVFGRFKAGKSSFLNHLAGRGVLPIGVLPLTAIVTRLRYGAVERAAVHFLDGVVMSIPVEDIGLYVGENENPQNAKQVVGVEVELPALQSFAPLEFVDTPGLGSAFTHNTEVALNWLPNAGAALVAVSADAPLSERDLDLLDELRRHTPKIAVLLTKADLLTESQRTEVGEFLGRQLAEHWGDGGLPVFFYSIKPDLQELKTVLVERLLEPLRQDRGAAAEQISRHKLISLISRALDYLQVGLAVATQAETSRNALREKLAEERKQFDLLRTELNVLSCELFAGALDVSLAKLQPTQFALQTKITTELREQFPHWKMRLPRMLEAWHEWMGGVLNRELSEVSRAQRTMFCEPVHGARQHLTRTLRALYDRLAAHVKSALGVTLTPHEFILELSEPTAPPVDVAFAFDAAFATIGWLIPLALFRRPIERVLLRKARYEVEKNLSRLAAGWHDRVSASIKELTRQAEKQALDELAALEQTLAQTASNAPKLREAIDELEEHQKRLRSG